MKTKTIIIALCCIALSSFTPVPKSPSITIQPYGNIPPSYVSYVYKRLHAIIPTLVIADTKPLPRSAYFAPRNRYRADSLLDQLCRSTPSGQVTIGLTIVDISCTDPRSPDWGIFGLSYMPSKACIASSFRNKTNKPQGLFFTAIHELGHTQGLDHCPNPSCVMQDAKGHTINATSFCPKCKKYLKAKGWKL